MGVDFSVGYSPERTNPGDKVNTIRTIKKIVSANSPEALEEVANVYSLVVDAGIHKAPSIKVAEAGKIVENVQRDINIALVNELSIMFNKMGVNTFDVLEAAGTKWNFHNYKPGLVGGHCIGVDPYYLTHKAASLGYHAKVVNSGRYVNDSMGFYVGKQTVKKLVAQGKNILDSHVLILGATFKENVSDVRNSKVADVYKELISFGVNVDVADPFADSVALEKEYGITLTEFENKKYDAIILAVNHAPYMNFTKSDMKNMLNEPGLLIDVKGVYKDAGFDVPYWSL
jgi:UDP-N-acetyl-D-galactosamine dehydrogenase